MKIFIIGSEGFIGRYLIRDLKADGHEITGFDLVKEDGGKSGYRFVQGDLMDGQALKSAMSGSDLVINLAARHHDFGISREDFFKINEAGTRVIVDVMTGLDIKRLIFYSSVAVYGDVDEASSELTVPNPVNDYGESKLAGEKIIGAWAGKDPLRSILIVRPVVVYGPHNYANMFRLIDMIFHRRFWMVGDGQNIKSTAYVENLTQATVFMMKRMAPGIDVINYSDYPHRTSRNIADIVRNKLGRAPMSFTIPLKFAMLMGYPFDILAKLLKKNFPVTANRIKKFAMMNTCHGSDKVRAIGFKQMIATEEGISRMVEWYLSQGRLNRKRCASGPVSNAK
ncbi:MAG: NAD(P)-dependent oxidoreductase [Candidatus Omnitrophota bacterium]